jgi:hypothetical protein
MARRSSTLGIGALNRVAPPSVLTETSRVCALAIPWTATVATNVPRTVVAIFRRVTRTTLTCFMLCLLALSGDRANMVQERDHARVCRENRMFSRHVSIDPSDAREEPATACDDRFTVDCDVTNARAPRVQRSAGRVDERVCKYKEGGVDRAPRRSTAVREVRVWIVSTMNAKSATPAESRGAPTNITS